MNKDELRYRQKVRRRYLGDVLREHADGCIYDIFLAAFKDFDSFFIYNSFGTEADTKRIIAGLLAGGKRVYLPKTEGDDMYAVPYFADTPLQKSHFGMDEPCGEPFSGYAQVSVAPLLAVNSRGYRLGYGGGFYDRYFKGADTLKVGLGYYFQMEDFEECDFDERLDMFVCERGIYYFGERRI